MQTSDDCHLGNTLTGVSRPFLDRFAPNLVCRNILPIRGLSGAQNNPVRNSSGQLPPYWIWFADCILVANENICVIFGRQIDIGQIGHCRLVVSDFSQNSRWQWPPSSKYSNRCMSTISWLICNKFDLQTHAAQALQLFTKHMSMAHAV